jgi:hypothetical protein
VDIDGWRLSARQAAAFRFSSVADSYAARTGSAREVGVIGVAIFPERVYLPRPLFPYQLPERRQREDKAAAPSPAPAASGAGEAQASAPRAPSRRPGLGTEFGEEVASATREVPFTRASASPAVVLGVRYNDRAGLLALGIDVDGDYATDQDGYLRQTAVPFPAAYRGFATPPPGWRR